MRRSTATRLSACATLALAGLFSVGCSQTHYFRTNPSPNTSNLDSSSNEIDNQIALTNDTNWRAMSNDLGRVLLLDKPSSLTLIPAMPHSWR